MSKKYKIILTIIVVIITLAVALLIYFKFFHKAKDEITPKVISNVVDNIEKFGYTLDERDSNLMKEEYNKLKDILGQDEIDYNEYANSLAKLFVIDLYTIDNKINKYDVGSLEYIFETEQEKFKTKVMDTLYELVKDSTSIKRNQELPIVSSINVVENTLGEYELNGSKIDAYNIKLEWDYVKDLGYDKQATVTIVRQEDKLYVIEYNPEK
ncbi:MAG: hypothetical protein IJ574_02790 [Bacilli bacterium]|nr:hypothetical protein [Bacilli bacterium]